MIARVDGSRSLRLAPRGLFEQMLAYAVIPTFDLVLAYGEQGVIVCRRRTAPYKGVWALPGLRMMKPEGIDDTIRRIANEELGLEVETREKVLIGQYVGRFRTEHERQDLSTAYFLPVAEDQPIKPNESHFSSVAVIDHVPARMGAMYRFYLERYFASDLRQKFPSRRSVSWSWTG